MNKKQREEEKYKKILDSFSKWTCSCGKDHKGKCIDKTKYNITYANKPKKK